MSKAKKTTKYAIIQDSNLVAFVNKVNSLIKDGYDLHGGLCAVMSVKQQNEILYTQAFTYETTSSDEKIKIN